MHPANPWAAYRSVATQTASPGQLVLMLFDGAIRFLECALTGFSKEDPVEYCSTINNNVLRAQAIIHELNVSLNVEQGGEFAQTMRRLYDYFDRRLQESNVKKIPVGIQEVIQRLSTLREAWSQMLQGKTWNPADEAGQAPALMAA